MGWNMLLFMWVHYHPAQLGLSEFTLDDLTSHDGGGFFFQLTLVMRYKGDMCPTASLLHICALCVRTHTAKHRNTCFHICTGMSCTRNLCITVHWLFRRHENMLTCHCDAYYGCLWRWKLTFSMVFSLKGGVMGTINLPDLRTLSWHITHPFAVASW